jgi:signal transduction histidine kinase/DNA-binding LacI/PurR family transcriptional regulator/AraC-like DNA-binding protein/ActR/RegA family two-component response regulator
MDDSPQAVSNSRKIRPPGRRLTLGLLTHGAGDPNSHMVWAGVAAVAQERDVNLICFPGKPLRSPLEFEAQSNVLYELVSQQSIDGLVIWSAGLPLFVDRQEMNAFCRRFTPLPMVTAGVPVEGIPGVSVDNYRGMRAVVSHLVEVHHRTRIAFIRGPEYHQEAEERYRAYLDVLADYGIPHDPTLIVQGNFKESGGAAAAEQLLAGRRDGFDALVAASDNMAIGALRVLQTHGVRIPGDVALAGLNDESQSPFVTPPLTTGPLHFYEQARKATEMLLALLAGAPVAGQVVLPTQLLIRQSCGCPDPLVAGAAAAGAAAAGSLAVALAARREPIIAEMMLATEAAPTETAARLAAQLLDGFAAEVAGNRSGAFLEALSDGLRRSVAAGEAISWWQGSLSALRRELIACAPGMADLGRAENLWQQARVMIGETAQRVQAYQLLQAEEQARTLGTINQMLSTAIDLPELTEILARALPQLGIPSCYLALYENPDDPAGFCRLMVAYDRQGRITLEAEGRRFPARQLVPEGLLRVDRRHSLVVEPLYFRLDQLGFILFEADPGKEEVYELLRGQISGALKRTQLVARNIELYNEAVKARVAAEDGRRLAEDANHLKSRFLATVSHELRTPLSLIVGTIEMMQREEQLRENLNPAVPLPEGHLRDLASIHSSAQHLARLIADVLDLASSQAGELRLVKEQLRLSEVLTEVVTLAEPMARERGLTWTSDIPAELPIILGDRTRLQQVTLNLVSNAIKFTEQGAVSLWVEVGRKNVVVAVSDTGMGIPVNEQESIFNEFRQSDRTARRGYGGMGLGLAISRRLVELHGGQIGLLSSGTDGAGSTFYFTLPIMAPSEDAPHASADRGQVVLLLTECADGAARLQEHLTRRGFEVETLTIAEQPNWLAQIVLSPPGAVVLDYEPAAERGWELMQILKLNPTTHEIPVLFYAISEAQGSGAVLAIDYLAKPVDDKALVRALVRQGIACKSKLRKTVLIVDDEPAMLDLHARIIQSHMPDCRVLKANNGMAALAAMTATRPDLVLLDLMMPEMDGFGVLQAMQQTERVRGVPVIVLTAQILAREDMDRLQGGVAAVLGKELFTQTEVLAQVEAALAHNKRLGSETQRVVRQAMAYIHEHHTEPISREELAQHLAVNERYLTRCFRLETGVTPIDYLLRYRVRQARALLEQGHLSVTDVAMATGFSDSSYFGRVFQREVGISPNAYKRGQRQPSE